MFRDKKSMERIAAALEEFVGIQKEAMDKVRLLLPGARTPPFPSIGEGLAALPPGQAERLPDGHREEAIEEVLNVLDEEIKNTGPNLLRAAMKEAMLDSTRTTEEIKGMAEKLQKTTKRRLKRKRGCLFLEIGDGIEDPIEELHIRV